MSKTAFWSLQSRCLIQRLLKKMTSFYKIKYSKIYIENINHKYSSQFGRKQRGTKESLDKVKKESKKTGLNLDIQKTKVMAFSPIILWQIDGEQMETVTDFLGIQNHCKLWWKPWNSKILAPWKKCHDKPWQCIKKQRHHFADKSLYSQLCFFQLSCMDIRVGP